MPISRIDLDENGAGSPDGLVLKILKAEPSLSVPIPIEQLCQQLDISSIEYETLDGLEGGLITNSERESGIILVKKESHPFRQRFTIGHELGHFLIPTHMPGPDGRFLCSRADMLLQHANEQSKRARMEVEANRFSSLILIPPPILRSKLKGDPNFKQLTDLALEFEVSKEAMARAYSSNHQEILAFVVTENCIVRRIYKHVKFPYVVADIGKAAPEGSLVSRNVSAGHITDISECLPDRWISVERGKTAPKLYEQVIKQRDNFAMTMLWVEFERENEDEDFDREESLTSKQRYRDRMSRSAR